MSEEMKLILTPRSHRLFMDYVKDAGNWNGTPLVGGNVGEKPADKGNLTDLKRNGLVETEQDCDNKKCYWLTFTAKGQAYARSYGMDLPDEWIR